MSPRRVPASLTQLALALGLSFPCLVLAQASTYEMKQLVRDLRVTAPTSGSSSGSSSSGSPSSGTSTPTPPYRAQLSTTSLSLDAVVGDTVAKNMSFMNTGTNALSFASPAVTVTGEGLRVFTNCVGSLGVGQSCEAQVQFSPLSAGEVTGLMSFSSNAPGSPHTVALSATARQAFGSLVANTSSDYGSQTVGGSTSRTFTFMNSGTAAATGVYPLVSGAGFSVSSSTCGTQASPTTILANNPCTVTVTFAPSAAGSVSGQLSIASSASNSPSTVSLTATAVAASPVGDGTSTTGACASGEATGCAVWNQATATGVTVQANARLAAATINWAGVDSSVCKSSGKWYVEVRRTTQSSPSNYFEFGINKVGASQTYEQPSEVNLFAYDGTVYRTDNSAVLGSLGGAGTPSVGSWVGMALDLDSSPKKVIWKTASASVTTDLPSSSGTFCVSSGFMHGASVEINAGQQGFQFAPPAGYVRGLY